MGPLFKDTSEFLVSQSSMNNIGIGETSGGLGAQGQTLGDLAVNAVDVLEQPCGWDHFVH